MTAPTSPSPDVPDAAPTPEPAAARPAAPAPAPAPAPGLATVGSLAFAADGSYAARLVAVADADGGGGGGWCPERWTLDGPEPYAVRLPGQQPEDPDSPLLPLPDGRVLIGRRAGNRYHFSLLYPSGPDTGETPLGAVAGERLVLLPPTPDGSRVYALASDPEGGPGTSLWLVCGGTPQPELVTRLDGRCAGGAWLDQAGGLLALNRTDATGRTRAIAVPVAAAQGGPPSELLRIADDSNDRLLLADPDSGLLLVASDAPGRQRIGWGVLGSHRPVRFPEALDVPQAPPVTVTPFAMQPGQVLLPEGCAVALRMTTAEADWVAVWRPQQRELQHLAAPPGWFAGTGRWTPGGALLLPYSTSEVPCGLARIDVPVPAPQPLAPARDPRERKERDEDADSGRTDVSGDRSRDTPDTGAGSGATARPAAEPTESIEQPDTTDAQSIPDTGESADTAAQPPAPTETTQPPEPPEPPDTEVPAEPADGAGAAGSEGSATQDAPAEPASTAEPPEQTQPAAPAETASAAAPVERTAPGPPGVPAGAAEPRTSPGGAAKPVPLQQAPL